jgi:hypothetical protein
MHSLYVPFAVDNILVNDDDQLIAAGHPNALLYLFHEHNPREYRAPSEVVIFSQPKSSESTYEELLLTNGELLSGSTTGGTYKQKLVVSALYDPGILLCQDLF